MQKIAIMLLMCLVTINIHAQKTFKRHYENIPLPEVLKEIDREQTDYDISFIYDDLRDFTITADIKAKDVHDAIVQVIGLYNIKVKEVGSTITVECGEIGHRLKGTIIDNNGNPIEFANVQLLSPKDSTYITGGVSNESGRFVIPCSRDMAIMRVSYIGMKTLTRMVNMTDIGTIKMQADEYAIKEVTVKGEKPLMKMVNNRLTCDVEEIRKKKIVSNSHELLKELPMVVSKDGKSIDLTGAPSTTICISGKPSHLDSDQMIDYLKALPAEEVEKVELIYNAPAQFHVKGAVINVVLKKKNTYTMNGQLAGEMENQHRNSYNLGGSLFMSSPKWNVDVMYKFADNRSLERTDIESLHTLGSEVYDINSSTRTSEKRLKHTIYSSIGYDIDKNNSLSLTYNGLLTPKDNTEKHSDNSMFSDSRSQDDADNYTHNLSLSFTSKKGISAGLEYTNYVNTGTQYMETLDNDAYANAFTYWRKQKISKLRTYLDMSHSLGSGWALTYGASYDYVSNINQQRNNDYVGTNNYETETDVKEHTASGYVGASKSFLDGMLSIEATLTDEYYKIEDFEKNALLPVVNVTFRPSPSHIFQLGFNSHRAYPSYWRRQDYTSFEDEYTMYQGNPDLKPMVAKFATFNYIFKGKYMLTVTYGRTDNFVISQSYQMKDRLNLLLKPFNIDYWSALMIDAVVPVEIGKWLSSTITVGGWQDRCKSSDWYGYDYDRNKWVVYGMMNSTFTLCQKPKVTFNCIMFSRTSSIQGIWDISSNWCVNAGFRCSLLNDRVTVSLQGNDLFESLQPNVSCRYDTQHLDYDYNFYKRNISLSFAYKFKGYKEKQRKSVNTSRFGIQ